MTHGSLFSGIGGFDLAASWMGWDNVFHCEWNPFGQKVLKHHFPNSISYNDITKTDFTIHRGTIDILTGGFPCQPYSLAGKRKGKEDDRHLWPEMLRAIREIQPRFVVGENVFGLIGWGGGLVFNEVQADLEAAGYEVFPYVLPACSVNAPHRRDRVWFVAHRNDTRNPTSRSGTNGNRQTKSSEWKQSQFEHSGFGDTWDATNPNSNGQQRSNGKHEINTSEGGFDAQCNIKQMGEWDNSNTNNQGLEGRTFNGSTESIWEERNEQFARYVPSNWQNFPTQSPICTGDDGIPTELDGITFSKWRNESIKAAGNAIVPQVAYQIFKAIEQYATMLQK